MTFSPAQLEMLQAPLEPARISTRKKQGVTLRYVEGHDVIDRANAIFGFHGWEYGVTKVDYVGNVWVATVLLTALTPDGERVTREDVGVGIPASPRDSAPSPDANETAIKGAVTDALKRALRTFGNAFGNSLYDKEDHAKEDETPPAARPSSPAALKVVKPDPNGTLAADEQAPIWRRIQGYAKDGGVTRAALDAAAKVYLHDTLKAGAWNELTRAQWAAFERDMALHCGQEPVQAAPVAKAAPANEARECPTCGGPMPFKQGTSKAGKAYAGYFCADRNCPQEPVWADSARQQWDALA